MCRMSRKLALVLMDHDIRIRQLILVGLNGSMIE